MLQVTVVDNMVTPPNQFSIEGVFLTLTDIKNAVADVTGVEPQDQLLLHGDRLMFHDRDYSRRFNLRDLPVVGLYMRLPGDQLLTVSVHCARQPPVHCSLRADVPVRELKNYLARKYCMAPWKQVLMALKAPMLETETVGAYAVRAQMEVSLSRYDDGRQPQVLHVTVLDEEAEPREQRFAVERRDTLDVLLGLMERAGVVQRGEKAHLLNQRELLDSRKSFEDHGLVDGDTVTLVRDK